MYRIGLICLIEILSQFWISFIKIG